VSIADDQLAEGGHAPRLTREQRRAHLLDVAAELVAEGGFEAVTMESVAAHAGVSKGLGYAYFDNRGELLAALFERETGELDRPATQAADAEASFEGKVRATVGVVFDTVAAKGPVLARLLRAEAEGPINERRTKRQRVIERRWARLIAEEYGVEEATARASAAIMLASIPRVIELWAAGKGSREGLTETYTRMCTAAASALGEDEPVG
jgi:AcrR family transcriptional regulator